MYVYKNVNPSKRITDDAYVRAISLALNITYKEAYMTLAEFSAGQCLAMNDIRALKSFLKIIGYTDMQLNQNCNVETFARQIAKPNCTYILRIGKNGVTVIKNKTIIDSFNPCKKMVTSYWKLNKE